MTSAFLAARRVIRKNMDDRTHLAQSGNQANLRELAEMFPELDASRDGITSLVTREISARLQGQSTFEASEDNDEADDSGDHVDPGSDGDVGDHWNGGQEGNSNRHYCALKSIASAHN